MVESTVTVNKKFTYDLGLIDGRITWGAIKHRAMREDYKKQKWFVSSFHNYQRAPIILFTLYLE